ncbi:MAG: flagellar M-ring protein FliF [Rhodospirillales bacterium]|nr:flagellar M-ring protein FliF [Alphaproteobacteria bacterium]MBL6948871.1 flagellar M-ring protein FliF [Rhodospirillales bacterium]
METLILALRNLGPVRLAVMGAVVIGMLGFFIFLATRLGSPSMTILYGDLNSGDSSQIVSQLQSRSIPYELKQNGSQILVPADQVMKLRLSMAGQGIPSGGSIGYELFDDQDAIGNTNFVQNINLVRALEGELSRTIQTIGAVRSARVHLVLPKRELFSREKQKPSASITVKTSGVLDKEQISAIQHLVAAAVPSLDPNRVSIVSSKGKLLARGQEEDASTTMSQKAEERRRTYENRLGRTIESLIEKTVGHGKVRAEIKADMDFDRISTVDEKYNPDGQVVRSTQSIEESNQNRDTEGTQPVSVGTNLPDPNANASGSASSSAAQNRTEETVNFEISKQVINHVRESGVVKRLSVAVLIDGVRGYDDNGDPTYKPRTEAEMELLATLVRGTIGFNADRGDTVEVINMEFSEAEEEQVELELFFGLDKNDLLRIAEVLVLSIVAILVILLVIRPLVSRAFESIPSAAAAGERLLADQAAAAAAALTAPGVPADAGMDEEQFEELIDIDRVEGRVKASSVKKVGEIVEKHPEEALSIIRQWMYQEG